MLKLTLERGKAFSRQAEAAAKFLARLIEEASREGWARVWVYPRPDAVAAGAAMFAVLASAGARPLFRVSLDPPPRVSVPTVLLGYQNVDYGAGDVDAPLAALAPRIERPPPPNSVYIDGDASNAGLVGAVLEALGGLYVRRDIMSLIIAGVHYGGRMDKVGKLYGVDEIVVDQALESGVLGRVELITSLKLYKPTVYTVCRGLVATLNPYYPGFTGRPDECGRSLAALGLEKYAARRPSELSDEDLKALARGVLSRIQEETGREVDVREYVGGILVSSAGSPGDYRMLADALVYTIEASESPEPALALAGAFDDELPILERYLESGAPVLASDVEEAKPRRLRGAPWVRAYLVDADSPQLFLWRALVLMGSIDREGLIVYERGDDLVVSAFQVEEALGYGQLKRLRNVKAIEGDGLVYRLRLREQ